jgi:hypothetical protein
VVDPIVRNVLLLAGRCILVPLEGLGIKSIIGRSYLRLDTNILHQQIFQAIFHHQLVYYQDTSSTLTTSRTLFALSLTLSLTIGGILALADMMMRIYLN